MHGHTAWGEQTGVRATRQSLSALLLLTTLSAVSIWVFSAGFLSTRLELPNRSSVDDLQEPAWRLLGCPPCWHTGGSPACTCGDAGGQPHEETGMPSPDASLSHGRTDERCELSKLVLQGVPRSVHEEEQECHDGGDDICADAGSCFHACGVSHPTAGGYPAPRDVQQPHFDRVVMLIVDALRVDFVLPPAHGHHAAADGENVKAKVHRPHEGQMTQLKELLQEAVSAARQIVPSNWMHRPVCVLPILVRVPSSACPQLWWRQARVLLKLPTFISVYTERGQKHVPWHPCSSAMCRATRGPLCIFHQYI